MTKLPPPSGGVSDVDFVEVVNVRSHRRLSRSTLIAGIALAAFGAFVAAWLVLVHLVQPMRLQTQLDEALSAVAGADTMSARRVERVKAREPREAQLLGAFGLLSKATQGVDDSIRLAGARAALALAMREGSVEAFIRSGQAHRDGLFGAKDVQAALRDFGTAARMNALSLQVGDPDAFYLQAQMAWHGLGVPMDRGMADKLARQAAETITSWRIESLLDAASNGRPPFIGVLPTDMSLAILDRAVRAGLLKYHYARRICFRDLMKGSGQGGTNGLDDSFDRMHECWSRWVARSAHAGHSPAFAEHGAILLREGDVAEALRWFDRGGDQLDPGQQVAYGLAKAQLEPSPAGRRRGFQLILEGLQKQTAYGKDVGERDLRSAEDYFMFFGMVQGVSADPENAERFAAAIRALADHFESVDQARTALHQSESLQLPARLFDTGSVREQAALLRGLPAPSAIAKVDVPKPPQPGRSRGLPDREQQGRTGYIPGAPRLADDGLSRFTVDNTRGAGDAIARLYLDGKRPAVRSFFVKQGEKFTADKLSPGAYVMRYRYMGSDDTYEAERPFALEQKKSEGGTQFSAVTVTLYKVSDGNLTSRKVSPDLF